MTVVIAVCPAMSRYYAARRYDAIPVDVREFLTRLVTAKMQQRHDSEVRITCPSHMQKIPGLQSTILKKKIIYFSKGC